ncbi:MAG: LamG domain-containing protein [Lentisphaerae bacterium]|nr:LamG domain-containing protein [Lentisphaerota bacterium]
MKLYGCVVILCASLLVGGASGGTIAYWTFDDAAPGSGDAGTLVTPANSPTLDATGTLSGTGSKPTFDSERGGVRVIDGLGGASANVHNRSSLRFERVSGGTTDGSMVSVADNALLRPTVFTAEAMIKVDEDVDWKTVCGKQRGGGCSWTIYIDNNGKVGARFDTAQQSAQTFVSSKNVEDGEWHHVAITYDGGTSNLEVYVDYQDVGGGTVKGPIDYTTGSFLIGNGAGALAFDGWIDEVRLSDTVLVANEFLRFSGEPQTIAYWTLDDGTPPNTAGTIATDTNSPALDGIASGNGSGAAPTFDSDRPGRVITDGPDGPWLNNKNSVSLRFINTTVTTANGGKVAVSDNDPLLRPAEFTIEGFFKVGAHVDYPALFAKDRTASGCSWGLGLNNADQLFVRVDTAAAANQSQSTAPTVDDGAWHHAALTYDANTRALDVYLDYQDVGGFRVTGALSYDTGALSIGVENNFRAFDGWIDEVRLSEGCLATNEFLHAFTPSGTIVIVK